ncbi:MAG TPA: hypothetical protein VGM51_17005 [Armatimonadota bacterium]|jgi:hypothetical protein
MNAPHIPVPAEVNVITRVPGGSETTVRVPLDTDTPTTAQLIRGKIAAEWRAGIPVGIESVSPEAPAARWSSPEDAVRHALDGYRAGWYVVQVDGDQPGGLDSPLRLSPSSRICFIRLYPLEEP